MRLKPNQSTHRIDLRMGCGERLTLCQTRFLDTVVVVRKASVHRTRQTEFTENKQ